MFLHYVPLVQQQPRAITVRLCVMMFLEYGVRGMWYPFLAIYLSTSQAEQGLGFNSGQVGWVLGFAGAAGSITAILFAGRLVDRYLNAERALAVFHFAAGAMLFLNASTRTFGSFLGVMILFSIAYSPTQSLASSLALTHLVDRERSYPRVRMWGTIGWIVTSALFTYLVLRSPEHATNVGRIPQAMRAAGVMAIGYALFAYFLLPKTPPADASAGPLLPTRALSLFRQRAVWVLSLIAIPVATIHTAYYLNIGPFLSSEVGIPLKMVGPTLAIAQLSEVGCLFILGPVLKRLGYSAVLCLGVTAQAMRFAIFAINPPAGVVCVSLALHGVAFACFFTTATLYMERVSTPDIRHSVQVIFGVILFGVGPALAGPYAAVFDRFIVQTRTGPMPDFKMIWWTQAGIAAVCAVAVALLFRPGAEARTVIAQPNPPSPR